MEASLETIPFDIASAVASNVVNKSKTSKSLSSGTFKEFLKLFPTTVMSATHGKVLLTMWGCSPFLALYMYWRKKKARKSERHDVDQPKVERSKDFRKKLYQLIMIIFPSMSSKSGIYIIIYTAILCSRVWITIKLASLVGELGSLMGKRDFRRMFLQQAWFSLWCYPAAFTNSIMKFFEKKIALQFRTELTKYLNKHYLSNRTFYRILLDKKIDNLDQRITADVELFCSTLTFIYGHLLKPILDMLFLSHSLAKLMGIRQLSLFYAYFFITNSVLQAIKPNFSRLVYEKQQLEGNYRADHARVIQFREEIAFVDGAEREREICEESYNNLANQTDRSLWTHLWMDIIDSYVIKYGGSMMAYSAVIPSVFVNWKQMNSQQSVQHYLTATTMLIGLANALKDIILSYKEVAKLFGLTDRVFDLLNEIEKKAKSEIENEKKRKSFIDDNLHYQHDSGVIIRNPSIDYIELIDCDIYTPDGLTLLVEKLSIRINPGEHVLVNGTNGTGKSSLFRTIGELWPLPSGIMKLPPKDKVYFISQNSYMCPGTLRDLITYPEKYSYDEHLHIQLRKFLQMVELTSLLDRFSWDSVENWQNILSGGETQRIAIARLYLNKPLFGILDECTASISVEMEHRIFDQAKELNITLLSIAHNKSLRRHHKHQLNFFGGGKWEIRKISDEEIL